MEDLKRFKDNLQFKKVFLGGYDKRDVLEKVDALYQMAGRNMSEQKAKEETLLATIEKQEKEIKELEEKQVKMREAYKEYCDLINKTFQ